MIRKNAGESSDRKSESIIRQKRRKSRPKSSHMRGGDDSYLSAVESSLDEWGSPPDEFAFREL